MQARPAWVCELMEANTQASDTSVKCILSNVSIAVSPKKDHKTIVSVIPTFFYPKCPNIVFLFLPSSHWLHSTSFKGCSLGFAFKKYIPDNKRKG